MLCPYCEHTETKVVDSRETENDAATRRRRECLACQKRFTTYERIETDLRILKKDKRTEQYDRQKLRKGILRACEKRPIQPDVIDKAIDRIEAQLRAQHSADVPSTVLGKFVMKELKKIDKIAYIRFASVYRDFADLESFEVELQRLKTVKR